MENLFGVPMGGLTIGVVASLLVFLLILAFFARRNPVLFKLGLRNIPRRRAQTVLIIVGLMLSTAIITAALALGDTVSSLIRNGALDALGATDVVVESPTFAGFGDDFLTAEQVDAVLASVDNDSRVDGAMPQIREDLPILNPGNGLTSVGAPILGLETSRVAGFDDIRTVDGRTFAVGALGARAGLYESASVRVQPTGKVTVFVGSHSHGQGHDTTFSQLVADQLGIPMDDVEIVHGDTDLVPFGMGTYGSRSLAVGGVAITKSIEKIKEKGATIAAHLLEASADDLEYAGGQWTVRGTDKSIGFGDVALTAYVPHNYPEGLEPGLEFSSFYDPANFTFPFGAHIAVVEVDTETGVVKLVRYAACDDVGNVVNPMIVDGQVHGGVTHGIGQALMEGAIYDDDGQLINGSYMDYALPRADELPRFETDRTVTPCPHNPLGVKGAGETGTIGATPAVVNAVIDALWPLGVRHLEMPLTPQRVWQAIQSANGS